MIAHQTEPFMPYQKEKLPSEAIEKIREWIELGAPYPEDKHVVVEAESRELQVTQEDREFWSFRPLSDPTPPEVSDYRLDANPHRPIHPRSLGGEMVFHPLRKPPNKS